MCFSSRFGRAEFPEPDVFDGRVDDQAAGDVDGDAEGVSIEGSQLARYFVRAGYQRYSRRRNGSRKGQSYYAFYSPQFVLTDTVIQTVQSISLLAYLAETHDIWGPFLVVSPASTLHNWQQEITRFVPKLKALPYWGNVKDRATLRKVWSKKEISYNEDAPFHVLITSYQLVGLSPSLFAFFFHYLSDNLGL